MDIEFASAKLQKLCEQTMKADRELGPKVAEKLRLRLTQLGGCDTLADMRCFPAARFHRLTGNRDGQYAVDLGGGMRLVVVPSQSARTLPAGGLDLASVSAVTVIYVGNYHE